MGYLMLIGMTVILIHQLICDVIIDDLQKEFDEVENMHLDPR
jgi:hypothetical protein